VPALSLSLSPCPKRVPFGCHLAVTAPPCPCVAHVQPSSARCVPLQPRDSGVQVPGLCSHPCLCSHPHPIAYPSPCQAPGHTEPSEQSPGRAGGCSSQPHAQGSSVFLLFTSCDGDPRVTHCLQPPGSRGCNFPVSVGKRGEGGEKREEKLENVRKRQHKL